MSIYIKQAKQLIALVQSLKHGDHDQSTHNPNGSVAKVNAAQREINIGRPGQKPYVTGEIAKAMHERRYAGEKNTQETFDASVKDGVQKYHELLDNVGNEINKLPQDEQNQIIETAYQNFDGNTLAAVIKNGNEQSSGNAVTSLSKLERQGTTREQLGLKITVREPQDKPGYEFKTTVDILKGYIED